MAAERSRPVSARWRDVPFVSVVIPVLNDAKRLETCLRSLGLQNYAADRLELIVVDNGSTDDSREVAERFGAKVYCHPGLRVGALRNRGVSTACGDVLAFVDSDHEVPSEWISAGVRELGDSSTPQIVGSHYLPPEQATWVQRGWAIHRLRGQPRRKVAWLGAGNFFVRRVDFDRLGGFNENLVAAEDVDLCVRMKAGGGEVICDLKLANVHHGEPATLWQFFRKERWRGSSGIKAFLSQGLPWRELPSLIWPMYHLLAFVAAPPAAAWLLARGDFGWSAASMLSMILPSVVMATRTALQARRLAEIVPLSILFLTYSLARAAALFRR